LAGIARSYAGYLPGQDREKAMTDSHDDLIRRAAKTAERSWRIRSAAAEIKVESQELAYRLAQARQAAARIMQRVRGQRDGLIPAATAHGADPVSTGPGRMRALPASSVSRGPGGNLIENFSFTIARGRHAR
jgi:hypothetical protein